LRPRPRPEEISQPEAESRLEAAPTARIAKSEDAGPGRETPFMHGHYVAVIRLLHGGKMVKALPRLPKKEVS
jgi:hypothetical protein